MGYRCRWYISETRRKGENCVTIDDGHVLLHKVEDDSTIRGLSVMFNLRMVPYLKILKAISQRLIYTTITNNRRRTPTPKFLQTYPPTSHQDDDEVEMFMEHNLTCLRDNTVESQKFYLINTFLMKRKRGRWTWISPMQ